MKLIYLSQQTCPKIMGGGNKLPRVAFNKSGTINFNGSACALMEIKPGDKVTLAQDEDDPYNWYFFKDTNHGFPVRAGYDKKGCLFNHSTMVKQMMSAINYDTEVTHNFIIAGVPTVMKGDKVKYWGIIVKPVD